MLKGFKMQIEVLSSFTGKKWGHKGKEVFKIGNETNLKQQNGLEYT